MKKLIVFVALVVLMVTLFLISGLFFLNSGIIDNKTGRLNELRTIEILYELEKIPLINIRASEIEFHLYGTLIDINFNQLFISSRRGNESFIYSGNLSDIKEGDKVRIYYKYSPSGEITVVKVMKISFQNELPEFRACDTYSVESCPDECVICPPCLVCSSISCQTKEFCRGIGFDEHWHDEIKQNTCE